MPGLPARAGAPQEYGRPLAWGGAGARPRRLRRSCARVGASRAEAPWGARAPLARETPARGRGSRARRRDGRPPAQDDARAPARRAHRAPEPRSHGSAATSRATGHTGRVARPEGQGRARARDEGASRGACQGPRRRGDLATLRAPRDGGRRLRPPRRAGPRGGRARAHGARGEGRGRGGHQKRGARRDGDRGADPPYGLGRVHARGGGARHVDARARARRAPRRDPRRAPDHRVAPACRAEGRRHAAHLPRPDPALARIFLARRPQGGQLGPAAWLPTEEVVLLLTTLVASGLLILGTVTLVRLPRPRGTTRQSGVARRIALAAPVRPGRSRTRELPPPGDRAATARRLGRTLLDRAAQESEPERRRTLIYRAIACLNRGIEAAPDDEPLRDTLTAAHAALWNTDEEIGMTVPAPTPRAPESPKQGAMRSVAGAAEPTQLAAHRGPVGAAPVREQDVTGR